VDAGEVLLGAAAVASACVVALSALRAFTGAAAYARHARLALLAALLAVLGASILLAVYLASSRLEYAYVHAFTRADLPLAYKLSALYTGQEGSFLFWAVLLAALLALHDSLRLPVSDSFRDAFRGTAALLLLALLLLVLYLDPFRPTPPVDLLRFPDGRGLNTLLVTPFTLVHPPIQFAAYAASALPFSAAVAFLLTREPRWSEAAVLWARLSWLLFVLALGIGALWSYNVLGWGGYWAWDPVETADLVPFLAATGLAHALVFHRRERRYYWTAPFLAVALLAAALFATFETKSGFVDSPLHTFTLPQLQVSPFGETIDLRALGAGDRLVAMASYVPSARFLISLLSAVLLASMMLFVARFAKVRAAEARARGARVPLLFVHLHLGLLAVLLVWVLLDPAGFYAAGLELARVVGLGNPAPGTIVLATLLAGLPLAWIVSTARDEPPRPLKLEDVVADRNLTVVIVGASGLWLVAIVALMIQGAQGLQPAVFESRLPFVLVPVGYTLGVYALHRRLGARRALLGGALAGAVAVPVALVSPWPLAAFHVLLAAATLLALSGHLARLLAPRGRRQSVAALLVLSGIAGMVFWASHPSGLLGLSWTPFLPLDVLGLVASSIALLGGVAVGKGASRRVALRSAIAGMAAVGFLVGLIASAIAVWLSRDLQGQDWRRRFTAAVRAVSPQLVHVGALLVLVGYAASTYASSAQDLGFRSGEIQVDPAGTSVGPYILRLASWSANDTDGDARVDWITARVSANASGAALGIVSLDIRGSAVPGDAGNLTFRTFSVTATGASAVAHGTFVVTAVTVRGTGAPENWTLPAVRPKMASMEVVALTVSARFFEGIAVGAPAPVFGTATSLASPQAGGASQATALIQPAGAPSIPLTLTYDPYSQRYRGVPAIVTAPLGDLYLVPQAIEVGGTWMEAGSAGRIASPGEVTAVAFSARSVPGMSALWGGLALMGFGIAARIASDLPARLRSPR